MKESISLDKYETDRFAFAASNDKNPIHSVQAGKRQLLPGDWQVFFYLSKFGSFGFNKVNKFEFKNSLKPLTEFSYNNSGFYLSNGEILTSIRKIENLNIDENLAIDVILPNSEFGIKYISSFISQFGNVAIADFVLNYLQASGDIGDSLLGDFFNESQRDLENKIIEKKILPLFNSGGFSFNPKVRVKELGELERRALNPSMCYEESKGNKIRTYVTFPFILNDKWGNVVGKFRKNLVCSYLEKDFQLF